MKVINNVVLGIAFVFIILEVVLGVLTYMEIHKARSNNTDIGVVSYRKNIITSAIKSYPCYADLVKTEEYQTFLKTTTVDSVRMYQAIFSAKCDTLSLKKNEKMVIQTKSEIAK